MVLQKQEVAILPKFSGERVQYLFNKGKLKQEEHFPKYNVFDDRVVINYKGRKEIYNG